MTSTKSQNDQVMHHLKKYKSIVLGDAIFKYGITRLASRIYDLKCMGHEIHSELIKENGKRFAKYTLVKEKQNG